MLGSPLRLIDCSLEGGGPLCVDLLSGPAVSRIWIVTPLHTLPPNTCSYAKRWFVPDFLASMPFDEIVAATGANLGSTSVLISLLKLPRLLRLSRITRYLERFKNANAAKLLQLVLSMFFFTHLMGCGYQLVGSLSRQR